MASGPEPSRQPAKDSAAAPEIPVPKMPAPDMPAMGTGFFQSPDVFAGLTTDFLPDLALRQDHSQPIRAWVVGCGSGEDAYSLAMLLLEALEAANSKAKLKIFASDSDAAAIAFAREGVFPPAIEGQMSAARLARFFTPTAQGYRVHPDLRASVIFSVHTLLVDPPFSKLDLLCCHRLLSSLSSEAQVTAIALFHFALKPQGLLSLGNADRILDPSSWFKPIATQPGLYRPIGLHKPGELSFAKIDGDPLRSVARPGAQASLSRQAVLGELCRRLVLDHYAPAAILINRNHDCLYSLGPTDRYLRVVPGRPSHDLLAMVRPDLQMSLRIAVQSAWRDGQKVAIDTESCMDPAGVIKLRIEALPLVSDGEEVMLIVFLEVERPGDRSVAPADLSRVAALEAQLATVRGNLQDALRMIDLSQQDYRSIYEETLSINEVYQSANQELVTSKEDLQSVNENLILANVKLQEELERQRNTANDLQNILYSSDVVTLFLDSDLRIRFFTPNSKTLFNVIPSDVGRPLGDLNALISDTDLLSDAARVLQTCEPAEQEVEAKDGGWYLRRVMPYRTDELGIQGVVITFANVTERRHVADALDEAKRQAELANGAKSRFLAAASHDLRQPLQTLALLQGLLAKSTNGDDKLQNLISRLGDALGAMTGMLNTLLDINQIEAGMVNAERSRFPINDLLARLRQEFIYQAEAQGLTLRSVGCSLWVESDPRLLEQILRNLLANGLKYTRKGTVLVGCRRRGDSLRIEIWDTGIGIADEELLAIFDEYHQVDNEARQRSRGLGLGLSIVRRLATLLGHRISVQSRPGKGSVFSIDVALAPTIAAPAPGSALAPAVALGGRQSHKAGAILVVEDDPDLRELLENLLKEEGHFTAAAADGQTALKMLGRGIIRPDLLLADYNLPDGMNGLQLAAQMRHRLRSEVPVMILTGDIATGTLRDIAAANCAQMSKPVKLDDLIHGVHRLLRRQDPVPRPAPVESASMLVDSPLIYVVDDDRHVRDGIRALLESDGQLVADYESCESFLAQYRPGTHACLLIDAYLPGMQGLELLRRLKDSGDRLATIMITGKSDVPMAVQAMKWGAADFIEKPISASDLLASIKRALEQSVDSGKRSAWQADAARRLARLTPRQREIMERVLDGHPSKNIAADLHISQRTVENHRASVMEKTGSKSLPALARLALAAKQGGVD